MQTTIQKTACEKLYDATEKYLQAGYSVIREMHRGNLFTRIMARGNKRVKLQLRNRI